MVLIVRNLQSACLVDSIMYFTLYCCLHLSFPSHWLHRLSGALSPFCAPWGKGPWSPGEGTACHGSLLTVITCYRAGIQHRFTGSRQTVQDHVINNYSVSPIMSESLFFWGGDLVGLRICLDKHMGAEPQNSF